VFLPLFSATTTSENIKQLVYQTKEKLFKLVYTIQSLVNFSYKYVKIIIKGIMFKFHQLYNRIKKVNSIKVYINYQEYLL